MEYFLGGIILWSGARTPDGWFDCNGQQLSMQQYMALYSIIGTMYGGDGRTYFNLPDLRGRVPVGIGPNVLPNPNVNITLGAKRGSESVTLVDANFAHTHAATFSATGTEQVKVSIPISSAATTNVIAPDATHNYLAGTTSGTSAANMWSNQPAAAGAPTMAGITTTGGVNAGTVTITANSTKPAPVSVVTPQLGLRYLMCVENGLYPNFL